MSCSEKLALANNRLEKTYVPARKAREAWLLSLSVRKDRDEVQSAKLWAL
jgi:hypothetical protein